MQTKVVKIDSANIDDAAMKEACDLIRAGELVAFPTETVYGAREAKSGSCGSVIDLFFENYGFQPRVYGGVRKDECAALLRNFFLRMREK